MIIAIDFDGTITEHRDYPDIGPVKKNAKKIINRLKEEGHIIIIWSCRPAYDKPMLKVLGYNGIMFDYINENCEKWKFLESEKIYADMYIDDRQLGGIPDDWEDIYKMIRS